MTPARRATASPLRAREEIGQTLSDPAQVEDEMRSLLNAFAEG